MIWNKKVVLTVGTLAVLGIWGLQLSSSDFREIASNPTSLILKNNPLLKSKTQKKAPEPLLNWGLFNSKRPSHIHAYDAWKIEKGSRDIVVAVIDTGIDPDHPDLKKNIWKQKRTIWKNKKNSSKISNLKPLKKMEVEIFGWDFVNEKENPHDSHGHGTHVAGIIGATYNQAAGVSGVSQRVSIMSIRYYSDSESGEVNLMNTVRAIKFAVQNGARIINYSGGGPTQYEGERLAILDANANNVLFVAAAGNFGKDTDNRKNAYYPASYRLSNILSVAATDIDNKLLPSSNFGVKTVDVAAPGHKIYSTVPRSKGSYAPMTGTSQATAFVTGVAALLLAQNPKLTPQQIKRMILNTVDRHQSLSNRVATHGKINAYRALLALKNQSPALKVSLNLTDIFPFSPVSSNVY